VALTFSRKRFLSGHKYILSC